MMTEQTIAVDLDGVLAKYERWQGVEHIGEPIPDAVEFTKALKAIPARVMIYTTRTNGDPAITESAESVAMLVQRVKLWLDAHGFAYDDIYVGQGKPLAAAYVDDRAVPCIPQGMGSWGYDTAVRLVKQLVELAK